MVIVEIEVCPSVVSIIVTESTKKSIPSVKVIVIELSISSSIVVENEQPLSVLNPASYNACEGSKSSGISALGISIPSIPIPISMPSSSMLLPLNDVANELYSTALFINISFPSQSTCISVVPSAAAVISSDCDQANTPISTSILLYNPEGLVTSTDSQSPPAPSEPSCIIPIVLSAAGCDPTVVMNSEMDSFSIISVKHALLFVALTS